MENTLRMKVVLVLALAAISMLVVGCCGYTWRSAPVLDSNGQLEAYKVHHECNFSGLYRWEWDTAAGRAVSVSCYDESNNLIFIKNCNTGSVSVAGGTPDQVAKCEAGLPNSQVDCKPPKRETRPGR